jgi:hypothetical protein
MEERRKAQVVPVVTSRWQVCLTFRDVWTFRTHERLLGVKLGQARGQHLSRRTRETTADDDLQTVASHCVRFEVLTAVTVSVPVL